MKYLMRISNTHRDISVKEIETLFQNIQYNWINDLLLELETEIEDDLFHLAQLSASIKWIIQNPRYSNQIDILYKELELNLQEPSDKSCSFAARFIQLLEKDETISKQQVERKVGSFVLSQFPDMKVNLESPDLTYLVVNSDNIFISGWRIYEGDYQEIAERSPKESPFFSGGAMKPMMSKLLVNLLHPHDSLILDPFAGHGGFLREVSNFGVFALGLEINWKIVRENHVNNKYHKEDNIQIIAGDSLKSPFRRNGINQVVTDPPYARQTTTKGRDRENLVDKWLENSTQDKIIMTLPLDMHITIPEHYQEEYMCSDYVHRSLTRVVRKLVRKR